MLRKEKGPEEERPGRGNREREAGFDVSVSYVRSGRVGLGCKEAWEGV